MSFSSVRPITSDARSRENSIPARSVVRTNIRAGAVPAVRSGTESPSARIGIVGWASVTSGTAGMLSTGDAGLEAGGDGWGCAGRAAAGVATRYAGVWPPSGGGGATGCGAGPATGCGWLRRTAGAGAAAAAAVMAAGGGRMGTGAGVDSLAGAATAAEPPLASGAVSTGAISTGAAGAGGGAAAAGCAAIAATEARVGIATEPPTVEIGVVTAGMLGIVGRSPIEGGRSLIAAVVRSPFNASL